MDKNYYGLYRSMSKSWAYSLLLDTSSGFSLLILTKSSARCSILVQGLQWSTAWYPPIDLVWFDRAEGHRGGDRGDSSTPCSTQHCVQQRKQRQSGPQEEGQKYRKINYSCYKASSNRRSSSTSHWDNRRDRQVHRQRLCYALAESD